MGPRDSALIIKHLIKSLSGTCIQSHGLMTFLTNSRGKIQQDWFKLWLSPSSNRTHRCMEDRLQIQGGPFWVVIHALRVEKCPSKFYEVDGWHIAAFLQLVFGCIPGWHHHLHQEFGRALTTYSTSPSNPMTTQTMCQLGEMFLWHEPGLISGYIIDEQGMHMDLSKIQVIIDWIALTTLKFIHIFLGLANFYWRFMLGFSHIT